MTEEQEARLIALIERVEQLTAKIEARLAERAADAITRDASEPEWYEKVEYVPVDLSPDMQLGYNITKDALHTSSSLEVAVSYLKRDVG